MIDGYKITKIEVACTANNTSKYGPGNIDGLGEDYSYDGKIGTWSGNATTSVTFSAKQQLRFTSIVVTYVTSDTPVLSQPELAFSETSLKVFKGMDYTVPTFSAKTSASVSFKSSNESVATVSAEGVITITGTAGKAIITATSPENEEYQAGSATCTITVVEAVEVIKASKVADGLHYALVVKVGDQLMSAYSNEDKNYEFLPKKEVGDNGESLFVETDAIYTFEKNGDDFAIKNAYDKYLYMDDTHNSYNYTTDLTSASNYLWSATIDAVSGEATITNIGKEKVVNYDSGYGTFGCYSTTSEAYTKPTLYILKSEADRQAVRNISSEKMGNGVIYDINGRRMSASYKGLVIINGVLKLQK
ncbi:MAG: Ig-like domain-containing protein [Bacteroidales bacterium]|nr:Ig-like domain-containing protein [Bacteroidales bacterium]